MNEAQVQNRILQSSLDDNIEKLKEAEIKYEQEKSQLKQALMDMENNLSKGKYHTIFHVVVMLLI